PKLTADCLKVVRKELEAKARESVKKAFRAVYACDGVTKPRQGDSKLLQQTLTKSLFCLHKLNPPGLHQELESLKKVGLTVCGVQSFTLHLFQELVNSAESKVATRARYFKLICSYLMS